MKPLTLEETRLKEEMKHNCFWDNIHYKNPEAEKAFNLICHLEDFEVQYWELQEENKQLKKVIDKAKKYIDCINGGKICSEFNPYLDDLLNMLNEVSK